MNRLRKTTELNRIAIITINQDGEILAKRLKADFKDARIFNGRMDKNGSLKDLVRAIFYKYDALIFIAAMGVTVRLVGPLARSKLSDPAVVSIDSAGRFAISVLSGHEGGANRLTFLVASCLGATPVITTGYEAHKKFIIGIGTRKGIDSFRVKDALKYILHKKKLRLEQIRLVATIDLKKNEKGLLEACADLKLPIVFMPKESIKHFQAGISQSKVAKRHLGVNGVCEPCALLVGRRTQLIAKKEILDGVTVAIAEEH